MFEHMLCYTQSTSNPLYNILETRESFIHSLKFPITFFLIVASSCHLINFMLRVNCHLAIFNIYYFILLPLNKTKILSSNVKICYYEMHSTNASFIKYVHIDLSMYVLQQNTICRLHLRLQHSPR